jgi:hypothetical protein
MLGFRSKLAKARLGGWLYFLEGKGLRTFWGAALKFSPQKKFA